MNITQIRDLIQQNSVKQSGSATGYNVSSRVSTLGAIEVYNPETPYRVLKVIHLDQDPPEYAQTFPGTDSNGYYKAFICDSLHQNTIVDDVESFVLSQEVRLVGAYNSSGNTDGRQAFENGSYVLAYGVHFTNEGTDPYGEPEDMGYQLFRPVILGGYSPAWGMMTIEDASIGPDAPDEFIHWDDGVVDSTGNFIFNNEGEGVSDLHYNGPTRTGKFLCSITGHFVIDDNETENDCIPDCPTLDPIDPFPESGYEPTEFNVLTTSDPALVSLVDDLNTNFGIADFNNNAIAGALINISADINTVIDQINERLVFIQDYICGVAGDEPVEGLTGFLTKFIPQASNCQVGGTGMITPCTGNIFSNLSKTQDGESCEPKKGEITLTATWLADYQGGLIFGDNPGDFMPNMGADKNCTFSGTFLVVCIDPLFKTPDPEE